MGEPAHPEDATTEAAPPTRTRRLLGLVAEVAVVLACVIALADWLWLGHLLQPLTPWLLLLLAILLLLLRRQPLHAAACLLGLLAASWPGLRVALEPAAPALAADAPVVLRLAAADLRGWSGEDPGEVLAALAATGAELIAVLTPPGGPLGSAALEVSGYRVERSAALKRALDETGHEVVGKLVLLARRRPLEHQEHYAAGGDGVCFSVRWVAEDGQEVLILIPAFATGTQPQRFLRQLPLIERVGELATPYPGPVVLCAPRAWDRMVPRWRRLAAATEVALPAAGLPAVAPAWLPRPFATADTVIAARGLAFGATVRVSLPGIMRDGIVVDLGPAPGW